MSARVLVACEYSGVVRDAFLARGYDAMSCDLLPTDSPGPHHQGDVRDILGDNWDLSLSLRTAPIVASAMSHPAVLRPRYCAAALPPSERNRIHYVPPGPDRWKIRSTTYAGIADAMAEQWGAHIRGEAAA